MYQDTDVVEKGLGVQMRKGVGKVSDDRGSWTVVGVDRGVLWVMSDGEWWWCVMMMMTMSTDEECWVVMGVDWEKGVKVYRRGNSLAGKGSGS